MSFIDWRDLFDEIFEDYSDNWNLNLVDRNDRGQLQKLQNCRKMERTGYAKFHCSKCSNSWSSAKAQLLLYYPSSNQTLGNVTMRFYGQQCKKCTRNKTYFVDPEFENEAIRLSLEKLHERIGWFCYGKERPPKTESANNRTHNFKGPHEKALCEACQSGRCDQVLANN